MRYSGMWAASVTPTDSRPDLSHTVSISSLTTLGIAAVTLLLLALAVLSCALDRRFDDRSMALRFSEERYRRVFERSMAGMSRATLDGRILDCNEAFALLLGYSSGTECCSSRVADLYADSAEMEDSMSRLKEQGAPSNVERCIRKSDGSRLWVLENRQSPSDHLHYRAMVTFPCLSAQ
jgi:PAS domain S-box-containing protein